MADYDGVVRIGTKIDTSGFKDGEKELEKEADNLGESLSESTTVKVKIDASEAEKELEKVMDKVGKEESRPYTPGYDAEAMKAIEEILNNQSEAASKVDEHFNLLKIDVEEYSKSLKELQAQGKFFGDEEYDKVYLAWKNATDAVKEYRAELNKKSALGQAKEAELQEAAQRRAEEQAEKALQKENERIQKQIENEAKLQAKEAERQAILQAQEAEEQRLDQIRVNAVATNDQIIEKVERIKELEQEIADLKKAGITEGYSDYDDRISELEKLKKEIKDYKDNLSDVPKKFEKMRTSAKKAFNEVSSGAKKSVGLFSTFAGRLKSLLLSLLIFNWISKAFRAMISGMKKGFENLMGYSNSYAQSVQNMKNSMATLGNQFAAAFVPIVQTVIPWLMQLINTIAKAMTYIAQFIALLTGASTFTRAKQIQDKYNQSLNGTAKAADKARGALAKFDDLDVLEKKEDASGAGGIEETLPKDMFEEVPIESRFEDIVQKAKEVFSQIFTPLDKAWKDQGEPVMSAWKYAFSEIGSLAKSVGADFLEVWNQPKSISVIENILAIIKDIGIITGNLASKFKTAWQTNNVGLRILEKIRDIFGIIIEHIKSAADYTVNWSNQLDFYPLLESINGLLIAIEPLTENIGSGLEWFYENVLLPIAEWTIEDAVPAFLDMLSAAITTVNEVIEVFKPLGQWLWEEFLQPLGQWTGDIIIAAIQTITDLLTNFSNWLSENKGLIEDFVIVIGSFFAAWEIVKFSTTIYSIVTALAAFVATGGLATVTATALGAAIAFITSPVTIATAIIGGLIAIGVLLYRNWEEISEKSGETWENIKETFSEFIVFMQEVFQKDWSESFGLIGEIMNIFLNTIESVFDSLKKILSGVIEFISGIFKGDWQRAWNGIIKIFEGVRDIIKGIINGILGGIEAMANGVIDGINFIIRALNNLSFDIPDWVPEFGGKTFGFDIKELSNVEIPKLATGAVIRGGNPFMAILGDQPAGKVNVEAPLDTIKQAVREELSNMNLGNRESVPLTINLNYDGETFARLSLSDILAEAAREGLNVDVLGVT